MNQFEPSSRARVYMSKPEVIARAVAHVPTASTGPAAPADVSLLCLAAGRSDLAAGLIAERATLQGVRARLAAEGAAAPSPAPVPAHAAPVQPTLSDKPPAPHAVRAQPAPATVNAGINAAEINARHRAMLAARQPGARAPSPVAQPPAPIGASGGIHVQAIYRRFNARRDA